MSRTLHRTVSRHQSAREVDLDSPEMLATVTDALMVPDANEWALRIRASLEKSVEAILETGDLLIQAKAALPHGQFEKMIESDLGWSPQTVRKFMAIARHPVLSDRARVRDLPASWGTLAELARLKPEPLEKAIAEGIVRSTMTRKDTSELVYRRPKRAKIEALRRQEEERLALRASPVKRTSTAPENPSPSTVLRCITEDMAALVGEVDVLRSRIAKTIASEIFSEDPGVEDLLTELGDELEAASYRLGGHYDDLAARCGLPTREQA